MGCVPVHFFWLRWPAATVRPTKWKQGFFPRRLFTCVTLCRTFVHSRIEIAFIYETRMAGILLADLNGAERAQPIPIECVHGEPIKEICGNHK